MNCLLKILLFTAGSVLTLLPLHSQPKSVGAVFTFSNIGLVYEHSLAASDSFVELSLRGETAELHAGRQKYPGISASLTWNIVFKEWLSSDGNIVRLFAGPGVMAGYTADFKEVYGFAFGLKGRIGGECCFSRNALISLSLSPVIGSHIVSLPDHNSMKYYKNGLIYCIIPEIGIKYRF